MHFSKNNNGYTLIELMISVLISMMLIAAASATYIAQNRSFTAQESVAEVNTQSKIAHDLVSNDIRSAGFGVALDMSIEPVNGIANIITPFDGGIAAPDAVTVVGGFRKIGSLWPVGSAPGISCINPPSVPLGTITVQIIYDSIINNSEGLNTTDRRFLSIDGIDFLEVANCGIGANNNCIGASITLNKRLTQDYPLVDNNGDNLCDVGRPVYLVEDITFCVNTNDNTLRKIRRNANAANCTGIGTSLNEVLADNIEDLQLSYARDTNGDGDINDPDNNGIQDDFVDGSAVADPSTIKAVRVNILARTGRPDQNYRNMGSRPVAIENHIQTVVTDDFKRRWWQIIVNVRNN